MPYPDLLPFHFKRVGRHNLVQMVNPERLDWSQGFFKLSLPRDDPGDGMVPFDEWLAGQSAQDDCFSGVSAIFHVARCGSTLLSQNIKATGQAFVLSEPPFFGILRHRLDGSVDYPAALQASLAVIRIWKHWALRRGQKLLVKFSSQLNRDYAGLVDGMAGARFVFLYRDPLPVLESLCRKPPSYLRRETEQDRIPLADDLQNVPADPAVLRAANRYCAALDSFSSHPSADLLTVDYRELRDRYSAIIRHFGLEADRAPAWSAGLNAKADQRNGPQPYQSISGETHARFAAANARVLAVAEEHYRRFHGGTMPLTDKVTSSQDIR